MLTNSFSCTAIKMTACLQAKKMQGIRNDESDDNSVNAVANVRGPPEEDINPNPAQMVRVEMLPFDEQLANHVLFTSPNFSEVSLTVLKADDAIRNRLNFKFIDLQLLRIITSNQSAANVYSRKRTNNNNMTIKFSRLILCRVHSLNSPEDNGKLVYMMEARNQNMNLWTKNIQLRDNGAISIGSFIRVPCPMPIQQYMRCDIPLLTSPLPAILLKTPRMNTHPLNNEIESNTSLGFIYRGAIVTIQFSSFLKTSCSGLLCDRQRVSDWNGSKGCGCYGMCPNSSSLVAQHAIEVRTVTGGDLFMSDFSSMKFSKLYLKKEIPGSCKLYSLQLTQASIDLFEAAENCIQLINNNGGFVVVGWYKRGQITDKSLIAARNLNGLNGGGNIGNNNNNNQEDMYVDSGEISYHIVQVIPTNEDFLDKNSALGMQLEDLKFDVRDIDTA